MIHVPRTVGPPERLLKRGQAELERDMGLFIENNHAALAQTKYKAYSERAVKAELNALFHRKCAYCEGKYGHGHDVQVEHFRPKKGVQVNGVLVKPQYFWLAAAWENLLPSCAHCNQVREYPFGLAGKGNHFPLSNEAKRARKPGEEASEEPLLLNPCVDRPEQYLSFAASGVVLAKSNAPSLEKARTSIRVYALMRPELCDARRDRAVEITAQIERVRLEAERRQKYPADAGFAASLKLELLRLNQMRNDDQVFAGLARALVGNLPKRIQN